MSPTRIVIQGTIGTDYTAADLQAQLALIDPAARIVASINSSGGEVGDGLAIYHALKQWPGGCDTEVIWALSIASLIAMAGDTVRVAPVAALMIHAPWSTRTGNASELRGHADALDAVGKAMLPAYRRSKQPDATIQQWLDGKDWWFDAAQMLALGLADELIEQQTTSPAYAAFNGDIPERIRAQLQTKASTMTEATTTTSPEPIASTAPTNAGGNINAAADRRRRNEIRAMGGKFATWAGVPELLRECEDDHGCTREAAGLRMLAHLGKGSEPLGAHYTYQPIDESAGTYRAACVDAILMRGGVRVAQPHPAARDLSRTSVVAMAERTLSMNGRSTSGMSASSIISAALSTSDFPQLLGGAMQKALLTGYSSAPATFTAWTAEREVRDFRPQTLASLGELPSLLRVNELAEYKHVALSESAETFALATFGHILALSRQALVNDDLGVLSSIPAAQGTAARRLESDLVYAKLTGTTPLADGYALFSPQHNNLAATGSALTAESLATARAAMRRQRGRDGQFIDPAPRYLIVPVALEQVAEQLVTLSQPGKSLASENTWLAGLQVVADPRLDEVSETAWFLSAAPGAGDGVTRVYLAGESRPALDERDGFTIDAREFKVRLDLAVGVLDFRGLYKNPGA